MSQRSDPDPSAMVPINVPPGAAQPVFDLAAALRALPKVAPIGGGLWLNNGVVTLASTSMADVVLGLDLSSNPFFH